tara:strand:+ start:126 stop:332 length:207 start_codon:yes stop_codon:yes gene_type:complete
MTNKKPYHLIVKGKIKGTGTRDQMWKRGQMLRPFTNNWSVASGSQEIANSLNMYEFLKNFEEEIKNDE